MSKKKTEAQEAAEARQFITDTAASFYRKDIGGCKQCGAEPHGKTFAKIEDVAGHPILGAGWGDDDAAIINPSNDYTYEWTDAALQSIADALTGEDIDTLMGQLDEWDSGEFADGAADVYTAGLLSWLSDNPGNVDYIGQAADEFGEKDGFKLLQMAQYLAIREHADKVRSAVFDYLQGKKNGEASA